jgi:nucleoid-associated protein YgaU
VLGGRDGASREDEGATREVVVRAGDSLWSVAARSLGGHATAAEIAREWPRWYRANRAVVGDNPDLLLVGTVLVRPGGAAGQEHGRQ